MGIDQNLINRQSQPLQCRYFFQYIFNKLSLPLLGEKGFRIKLTIKEAKNESGHFRTFYVLNLSQLPPFSIIILKYLNDLTVWLNQKFKQ